MRAVNLLPRDVERDGSVGGRAPLFVAGGGLAAVTAAAVVLFVSASGAIADQNSQLEALEGQVAKVPKASAPAVEQGTIVQERTDRVAALSAAISARAPVDRLLRELAYVLPEDAWLTGLTANAPLAAVPSAAPGATVPSAGGSPGVTIQGTTYTHRSVARVVARFAALPTLTDVRLTASARVQPTASDDTSGSKPETQKPVVTFTITANLRTGGPA
jgi:Tfp pilus assembly protein PilN